ncbi:protein phosphatase 2C [Aspergillus japonicus CBS 114.51]|uniref:Protein phosphatase n=1 Tax=Aspergillus japonicus CBS 114.51 TaxID=1448312 RepID=A0A8T8X333_ASPJA|nr:protein phosphatase 2C [Aspergillus japonicus CBS 114.51]RAH82533.1 protein phosphatase 2C [Aspergillus japonicus CBS 114.51]
MVPKSLASSIVCSSLSSSSSSSSSSSLIIPSSLSSAFKHSPLWSAHSKSRVSPTSAAPVRRYRAVWPSYGITTPVPDLNPHFPISQSPYCFQTGYALCAKRAPRPFPPPFLSPPSSSFSDPLTTHYLSQDKRLSVRGDLVRGLNNGDDAVLVADNYLAVNDGVGAWATKPQGHAALWARLLLHFWALEVERVSNTSTQLDPIGYLQRAYEETIQATSSPGQWLGTTTSVTALLHCTRDHAGNTNPLLYVTCLGDCKIYVIRPRERTILFRTQEQWHWFDCPMQLGTNSVDTPKKDAVLSKIDVQEGDIVLAVSDGVVDNLWEHEILTVVLESLDKWHQGRYDNKEIEWAPPEVLAHEQMVYVARELLRATLEIAQDPFAESPYMEKAIDEGLAIQGGKMDDISVVVGACRRREH